jgi:glycosyltransferase involved in cell wall biosynthesis
MCKNEEPIIRGTLDSLAQHIDYLVFVDTGSTDKTVEVVEQFMKDTGIPGEIHVDEWVEFDYNKTKMMEHARGKADYIIHLDSHMHLQGNFKFTEEDAGLDSYNIEQRRGSSTFSSTILWKGDLKWRFVGVRHTIMKCDSRPNGDYSKGTIENCWIQHGAGGMGSRTTQDPNKYGKDALALEGQFWKTVVNDPDGIMNRSAFYAAQSWMDQGNYEKSIQWNSLYLKLKNTWFEEEFEANLRIAKCKMVLNHSVEEIKPYIDKAIQLEPERAEPFVVFARHIFYQTQIENKNELAYNYMSQAIQKQLDQVKSKYILFISDVSYDKHLYDDFSVMCYHTGRFEEGMKYLEVVINDETFKMHQERLKTNLKYFKEALNEAV